MAADIQVETFDVDVADASTHTLTNDVGATSKAFVRHNSSSDKCSGGPTGSTGNTNPDDAHIGIELTDTDTLTFHAGSSVTRKVIGEVWRYTGSPGGANEFIVRAHAAVTITGSSASQAVSGISDRNDCVPFITGVDTSEGSRSNYEQTTFAAHIDSSGNLVVSRNNSGATCTVYVDVVEFTGSNWSVGHGVSSNHDTSSETVTLNTDSTGSGGSTFDVSDWETAFLEGSMGGDSSETGLSDCITTIYPHADTDKVYFAVQYADTGARNDATGYVHAIKNSNLVVKRESSNNLAEGNGTYGTASWPTGASTSEAIGELALEWWPDTSGTGTAHARGRLNARITDATGTIQHWVHRSGNTVTCRWGVIDLSALEDTASTQAVSGSVTPAGVLSLKVKKALAGGVGVTFGEEMSSLGWTAWWRLGESSGTTATDEEDTQDGTYVGSPTQNVTGYASDDGAVDLNGTSQYVSVPDNAAWDVGTQDFAIMAAVKKSSWPSGAHEVIFTRGNGSGADDYRVYLNQYVTDRVTFQLAGTSYDLDSGVSLADGSFHLIGLSMDRSGNVELFVDGSSQDTADMSAQSSTDISGSRAAGIGAQTDPSVALYLDGTVDEVAIKVGGLIGSTGWSDLHDARDGSGAFSPSGALSNQAVTVDTVAVSGSVTPTGAHTLEAARSLTGSVTPDGDTTLAVERALAGAVAPAGVVTKATTQSLAGAITPNGALSRGANQALSGSLDPSGTMVRVVHMVHAGTVTPSGSVATTVPLNTVSVSGAVTPTGATTKAALQLLAGDIDPSGALLKAATGSYAGTITPTGALATEVDTGIVSQSVSGSVAPSGAYAQDVALLPVGTIAPSGSHALSATLTASGAVSGVGVHSALVSALLGGSASPGGTLVLSYTQSIAPSGAVTPSGALSQAAARVFAGALAPTGATTPRGLWAAFPSGSVAPVGTILLEDYVFSSAAEAQVRELGWWGVEAEALGWFGMARASGWAHVAVAERGWAFARVRSAARFVPGADAFLSLSSVLPAGGVMRRRVAQLLSGSITPSGAHSSPDVFLSGSITPSGTVVVPLTPDYTEAVAGTVTPSAELLRLLSVLPAGSVSPSGAVARQRFVAVSGTVAPSSALVKTVSVSFLGISLHVPAGLTSKTAKLVLSGGVSPAGALGLSSPGPDAQVAVAGAAAPAGDYLVAGAFTQVNTVQLEFDVEWDVQPAVQASSDYDTDPGFGSALTTLESASFLTFHRQQIGNGNPAGSPPLTPGTTYYVRHNLTTAGGMQVTTTGRAYQTAIAQVALAGGIAPTGAHTPTATTIKTVSVGGSVTPDSEVGQFRGVTVDQVTDTSFRVTWYPHPDMTGQVEWADNPEFTNSSFTTQGAIGSVHIQDIGTGINPPALTPGTTYYFRILGTTAGGDSFVSAVHTQTTTGSAAGPRYDMYGGSNFPAFPTGPDVYVVPAGVSTLAEMQDWLDNTVPDGTSYSDRVTIVLDKTLGGAGTVYSWPQALEFRTREYIDIWGYNAKINLTSTSGAQDGNGEFTQSCLWFGKGSQGHKVWGLEIEGQNNPADLHNIYSYLPGENSHGICVEGARWVDCVDSYFHHLNGDAYLQRGFGWNVSSYIGNRTGWTISGGAYDGAYDCGPTYIEYNRFEVLARQGVANVWGVGIYIRRNIIRDTALYPIDLEDGDNNLRPFGQVYLDYNEFDRFTWVENWPCICIAMSQSGQEIYGGSIDFLSITGNTFGTGCRGCGDSSSGCTAFHADCHNLILFYDFKADTPIDVDEMHIMDNTFTPDANNDDCTRTDYGATRIEWTGTKFVITGNDLNAERFTIIGSAWPDETFTDNNGSFIQRTFS